MAFNNGTVWLEHEDQYLIEHHLTKRNRQIANELGRSIYSIECRLRAMRLAGKIPPPVPVPSWTEKDDAYLIEYRTKYTTRMLGEDLGRTQEAVASRLRRLREKGWNLEAMPRGQGRSKACEKARSDTHEPEIDTAAEREVLRDEIAKYIASLITSKRLAVDTASKAVERIKTSILQAPDSVFRDAASRRVADVVADYL